ncbi:hypothetical protein D3C87_397700 [compost metagenome]
MNKFTVIISMIFSTLLLSSCKSYQFDKYPPSDINRNTEESKKVLEAEREKVEINWLNNFGKPEANK